MAKSPQDQRREMIEKMMRSVKRDPMEWQDKETFFAVFAVETGASPYRIRDYYQNVKIYIEKIEKGQLEERKEKDLDEFRYCPNMDKATKENYQHNIETFSKIVADQKQRLADLEKAEQKADESAATEILAATQLTETPTQTPTPIQ